MTWPDGASDAISKRRMPIPVTRAGLMTARTAVAYLQEFRVSLPFWRKFFTLRFVHLSCCTGGQSLPRNTNKSRYMILYMIPPVISKLAKDVDQPQAAVILRVAGNSIFW